MFSAEGRLVSVATPGVSARGRTWSFGIPRVVAGGIALYAVVLGASAVVAYLGYDVARFDLGNMVQAVWSTAHGDLLAQTTASGEHASRLGSHVDPFLVLLVPMWLLWPSPLLLVVVQIVVVAAGALPVYGLALRHGAGTRAATQFAFAYLLYPATQFNALGLQDGFHAVSFAVPLILGAIYYLDADRLVPFAVLGVLAAATKEEIGAAVGCLGIWYAVRRQRRLAGLAIAVAGAAISLFDFLVVLPHYSSTGASPFAARYAGVGGTPTGIVRTAFTDPLALVHTVGTWHKLFYCVVLLVPFLGLWAFEPLLLLGAVPDLAINLLSASPKQTTIYWQYTAGIVPFVVAATVLGHGRLTRRKDLAALGVLVAAICLAPISPVARGLADVPRAFGQDGLRQAKASALAAVPDGVPVSASNQLGGLLSERRSIYTFPVRGDARWAIVDRADTTYPARRWYHRRIAALESSPGWRVVYSSHGVVVLRRS